MKVKTKLTIMVLPAGNGRVVKIGITERAFRYWVGGVLGLALITLGTYFISAIYLIQYPSIRQSKLENVTLRAQLGQLHEQMSEVEDSLSRIRQFEKKLRFITKLNDPSRNIAVGPVSAANPKMISDVGQFGPEAIEDQDGFDSVVGISKLQFKHLGPQDSFSIRKLYYRARQLYSEAFLGEQSIQEATELLRNQQARLLATPSILPVRGWMTSTFGYRQSPYTGLRELHEGVDVAARHGTPIMAPASGTVLYAGVKGSYGNTLVISHGYGITTLFAHCSRVLVRPGDKVERGEVIAEVGNTGRSTGPHLHYEVQLFGVPVDPQNYILE